MNIQTIKNRKLTILAVALVLLVGLIVSPFAGAETAQQEIERLRAENAQNASAVQSLTEQAASFEEAISALAASVAALQEQINANTAQQNRLKVQIAEAEAELKLQRGVLGQNIKAMYLEGDISTAEMLLSSKDLSHFVDKQQYRSTVKNKVKATVDKITTLKLQLNAQKEAVERLLKEQQTKQDQINANLAEQQRLLSFNQSQRDEFNRKSAANSNRIQQLAAQIAAQRRVNRSTDGGYYFLRFAGAVQGFNPDNYPYRNAGFSMHPAGCGYPDPTTGERDSTDRWGFCTRQCVSYAAWAVEASGRSAPLGRQGYGDAKSWVNAAYNYPGDVEVHRTPQAGDVAISTRGTWGHAMYVESVNPSNRTFTTSEYNTDLDGRLHYVTRSY